MITGVGERGLEQRGGKEFQGLFKNFKFRYLFSLRLGVRQMLLAAAPESSEKSLHPTSMPDCMQRPGVRGKASSHFWVRAGEASREERKKPGIRARGGQNKCESPRIPKGLGGVGVGGRPWTSLSGLYHKGQQGYVTLQVLGEIRWLLWEFVFNCTATVPAGILGLEPHPGLPHLASAGSWGSGDFRERELCRQPPRSRLVLAGALMPPDSSGPPLQPVSVRPSLGEQMAHTEVISAHFC